MDRRPSESPEGEICHGGMHQREGLGRQHRQAVPDHVSRGAQVVLRELNHHTLLPFQRKTHWQQHKSTAGVMTLLSDVLAPEFEAEATESFTKAKEKEDREKEKAKADEARGHRAAKVALDLENNSHRESAVK